MYVCMYVCTAKASAAVQGFYGLGGIQEKAGGMISFQTKARLSCLLDNLAINCCVLHACPVASSELKHQTR